MSVSRETMVFQNAYSTPFRGSDLECLEPSLAQQSFKDEVDINVMLAKFNVTGQMPVGLKLPQYGDYTGLTDYRSAMDILIEAQDTFMQLPANIRDKFGNSPQAFLEFCSDKKNIAQLREWGLAPEEVITPKPEPIEVRVIEPAAPVVATK